MTYFLSLESMFTSDAETKADAIEEVTQSLIELLQRGEAEWQVEEE